MRAKTLSTVVAALALTAGLAACAGMGGENARIAEIDQLRADCQAKGGDLEPISGAQGAHAATDYTCRIR